MKFRNVDATILLRTERNKGMSLSYLTGYEGDFGFGVFFKQAKKPIVFLSNLEQPPRNENVNFQNFEGIKKLVEFVKKKKVKTIGLHFGEVSKLTYDWLKKEFRGVKFVDVSEQIQLARKIKSEDEIKCIKKAVQITEELMEEVIQILPKARFEKEVEQYLLQRMQELDVKPSFPPIIASGWHGRIPHYESSKKSLVLKGFCIIDMGVIYKGYCSDLSRTIYLGIPSEDEIKKYQQVYHELRTIEQHVHAGVKEIHTSFKMIHALGHGVGREVHELPLLSYEVLQENMVIAIEPALYWSAGGIRVEDNYVVQKDKLVRLSKSSRKLRIFPKK